MKAIPRTDIIGTYLVVSGPTTYNVDLRTDPTCDCPSHTWRDQICKHIKLAQQERDRCAPRT